MGPIRRQPSCPGSPPRAGHSSWNTGNISGFDITKDGLWLHRAAENFGARLMPVSGQPVPDIAGRYRCAELDAELTVAEAGGVLFGAVSGWLGQGRMEALNPIATDLWALPCPRALDHTPPGDWTLRISRGDTGRPTAIDLGCWLARGLRYQRIT
ncbi:hypothetical protein AruPA_21215 [Acidiphilium sp. PA]|uniref:hypothetical protein n=1 Tax=Acidiphilium sp. PA TaxID=2871705 RepID=UPI002243F59E|nr:hypothetical protein [Acidiphilium sp. PA]MCW8309536.1 hypothetical protein [Acidiphilium sp. PA]